MTVKVSWTSWVMACTVQDLASKEELKGVQQSYRECRKCEGCGSAGSRHHATKMEDRFLPCTKTNADGATLFTHGLQRDHLPAEEMQHALSFCLEENHLYSTFT